MPRSEKKQGKVETNFCWSGDFNYG